MAALFIVQDRNKTILTQQQKEAYKQDGFLIMEHFLTEKEVDSLPSMSDELEFMPDERGSIWKYWNMQQILEHDDTEKGDKILDRIENFVDHHEGWANLFSHPDSKVVRTVSELFGEDAILWKEKLNFKKPGSAGFAPHQDAQAGWLEHNQKIHITVGVSVDETTIDNGCLQMVRGKHNDGLLGPIRGNMPQEVVKSMQWEICQTKVSFSFYFVKDACQDCLSNANLTASHCDIFFVLCSASI